MRYMTYQYATALLAALKGKSGKGRKEVLRNFFMVLQRNRDTARLSLILREAERAALHEARTKKVEVESAAPLSQEVKKEISRLLGDKIYTKESVKSGLFAGIKLIIDDELLIDASARRQLEWIFAKNVNRYS